MTAVLETVRRALGGFARFSGRNSPRRFWPYALLVVGVAFVAIGSVAGPIFVDDFARMQQFAIDHPDQATVVSGRGSYSIEIHGDHPELVPDLRPVFTVSAIASGVAVALLAAAVARRLHDRGRRGYWGLMPLPFLVIAQSMFPKLFAEFSGGDLKPGTLGLFASLFLNNLLYLASLVLLIALLAKEGDKVANRFGPPED